MRTNKGHLLSRPLETPTGGYMSEDQCSDMSGDQPQSMQTGELPKLLNKPLLYSLSLSLS